MFALPVFRVRAVSVYNSGVDIDSELKRELQHFLELCREYDIHPRLIGGARFRAA
jgi:hypothetical protein